MQLDIFMNNLPTNKGVDMTQLGSEVKDIISGVKGIATGRVEYITGCNQVLIQPQSKDGSFKDSFWIDEQRVIVLGKKIIQLDNGKNPGFDKPAPKH